ncbi:MAG: cobalt-precorrin 5A hydrolase [Desulfotomaculales bacterium]
MKVAAVVLSWRGWELARKVVPEDRIYAPAGLSLGVPFRSLSELVGELFSGCDALVFVTAVGIAARLVAPHLRDKFTDPAVVVVDEGGRFAVSLLGGHHRGANELAERIAAVLGAQPVVTTASEVLGRPAVDLFARRYRCHLGPRANLARVAGALVRGEPVTVLWDRDLPRVAYPWPPEVKVLDWGPQEVWPEGREALVVVTDRAVAPPRAPHLFLRPRRWVAGVGCRRGTPAGEILEVLRETAGVCGLAPEAVGVLATVERKRDEPGLLEAARLLRAEARFYPARELAAFSRKLPPGSVAENAFVKRTVGVANVCELAAMLAAGSRELALPKRVSRGVTVALARAPWP